MNNERGTSHFKKEVTGFKDRKTLIFKK